MIVTPRDKKLFVVLAGYGIMSTTQIRNLLFPSTAITAARRRLRLLEEKKYLLRIEGCKAGLLGWAVTSKAAKEFGLPAIKTRFNKNSLEHDLAISELRFRMESRFKIHQWISDHHLKANTAGYQSLRERVADSVPDSLFSIETNTGPRVIALEMELTQKSKSRYLKIFERYANRKNVQWIWYVVANENLGRSIEKCWKEYSLRSERSRSIGFVYSVFSELETRFDSAKLIQLTSQFPLGRIFVARISQKASGVPPPVSTGNNPSPDSTEPSPA